MGTQNEITESSDLFNEDGSLVQRGWARKPILKYNKNNIGKGWSRIKEWDHYSVLNKDFGFQLTIGDIGFLTQMSYVWLDFENKKRDGKGLFKFFTKSKLLPLSSLEDSVIEFPTEKFKATITKSKNRRILSIDDPKFQDKGLKGTISLADNPKMDNTVVVTGYKEDPRLFYYNHKIYPLIQKISSFMMEKLIKSMKLLFTMRIEILQNLGSLPVMMIDLIWF